jgi:hypothetical protein
MAYTETGFKRSMKIIITKTGNDGSVVESTYDGQEEFVYNGTTYTAIASDDDFRRLERNGVNGDWDVRLNAFKGYVFAEAGPEAYATINWDLIVQELTQYSIKIMQRAGGQGEILCVSYVGGVLQSVNEDVYILLSFTGGSQGEQFTIPSGQYYSNSYSMTPSDIDLTNVSSVSVSPTISANGVYTVSVDPINEF